VGDTGDVSPTFSDGGDIICHVPSTIFYLGFVFGEFSKKSNPCHVLCEELFMLDVTHGQVNVETEKVINCLLKQ